jgi:hypothetical protein
MFCSSGFHRCFSGTIALNLLIESKGDGPGSLCFGTNRASQEAYGTFMEALGKSADTDWTNTSLEQLQDAAFPIYVTNQFAGDLVVFPALTAHQIWNIAPTVTKAVWNILHVSSITTFFNHVQPAYQRLCHRDTARAPLVPINVMRQCLEKGSLSSSAEMSTLWKIFHSLVEDEIIVGEVEGSITRVDLQGAVVECNYCGQVIWNRHLHCKRCTDFDLCMHCFIAGRSCEHTSSYIWAEIYPRAQCIDIVERLSKEHPEWAVTGDTDLAV